MARVFVAMSGGVDSSVAAALLARGGPRRHRRHDAAVAVLATTRAAAVRSSAVRDARRVCDLLGIPHYTLNFREAFEREVVAPFADEYAAGRTPNPCIVCNDRVKFADLLAKVARRAPTSSRPATTRGSCATTPGAPWLARGRRRRARTRATSSTASRARSWRTRCSRSASCTRPTSGRSPSASACRRREAREPGGLLRRRRGARAVVARAAPRGARARRRSSTLDGTVLGHARRASRTTRSASARGSASRRPSRSTSCARRGSEPRRGRAARSARGHARRGRPTSCGTARRDERCRRAGALPDGAGRGAIATLRRRAARWSSSTQPLDGVAPGQAVVCYRGDVVLGGGTIACAS